MTEFTGTTTSTTTSDKGLIEEFFDIAAEQERVGNNYGRGFWTGRAVQHAKQNDIDLGWVEAAMSERGLGPLVLIEEEEEDA